MQKLETLPRWTDDGGFAPNVSRGAQQRFLWGSLLVAIMAAVIVSLFFVDYLR